MLPNSTCVQLTGEDLLEGVRQGRLEGIDSAAISAIPQDILSVTSLSPDQVMKGFNGKPFFLRIYETHWGRIGQIALPISQVDLYENEKRVIKVVEQGLKLAGELGAGMVSLQGNLPSATEYGKRIVSLLGDRSDLPRISTGHAITISAVIFMIEKIVTVSGRALSEERVGVLGLGSIGTASLRLMLAHLPHPQKIILCDVYLKRDHLERVAEEVKGTLNFEGTVELLESEESVPEAFYEATLILGATNVPNILDLNLVQPGTLIVDDSAPHCFDVQSAFERLKVPGDILFTEGGVLRSPEPIDSLRHVPNFSTFLPEEATEKDIVRFTDCFKAYSFEQDPHEVMGCLLAGLLHRRFPDIKPTIGLIDLETSGHAFRRLKELGFEGADLRCIGRLLPKSTVKTFQRMFGEGKGEER